MFVDRVLIQCIAGKGGNGIVAWRREKFIPKGGPSGGNGGIGGSIVIESDINIPSLEAYRNRRIQKAEDGAQGGGNCRSGRNGRNLPIHVPVGTLVKDSKTGEILFDFTEDKQQFVLCRGGKGGKGNDHFKSPTHRAPAICTPGKPGESADVELELKLIADVGLVGFPNAGKSTFISKATHVEVKIAPYPFTTLKPNLGYAHFPDGERLLIADIPGIIEGAHRNRGLGFEFLRHIERTKVLVFMLDASGIDGRTPWEDYQVLKNEVGTYNPELLEKPYVVVLNKIDTEDSILFIEEFKENFKEDPSILFEASTLTNQGVMKIVEVLQEKSMNATNEERIEPKSLESDDPDYDCPESDCSESDDRSLMNT